MGLFDNIDDLAKQHEDKIEEAIERAGDMVDDRTDGKYAEHVDRAQDFANDQLDKRTGDRQAPEPEL
ncbi:antitoxin [Tessaracoccus lubricantis]|uniref:Antitoxin n=1 Tax=Tessaracoccus lubricantis TaxID=545543 RepID=A0ABP9FKG8_9ACTN